MKVIYFAPIGWDDLKQRPQHIAEALSKEMEVIYIEPSLSVFSNWKHRRERCSFQKKRISSKLTIIRPSGYFRLPKIFDIFATNTWSERRLIGKLTEDEDLIWVGHPIYYSVVRKFSNKVVYDKMDEFDQMIVNKGLSKWILKSEQAIIKRAKLTVLSSESYVKYVDAASCYCIMRNGIERNFLASRKTSSVADNIEILKLQGSRIYGYVGTIDSWFDFDAISTIVNNDLDAHVCIVGRIKCNVLSHERVHYMGIVSKEEVPTVISSFDIALYTFKKIPFVEGVNPVKVYEYMALNKPIISVNTAEIQKIPFEINVYNDIEELKCLVSRDTCLKRPCSSDVQNSKYIEENSWENRALLVIEEMRAVDIFV